jgi:DNA-binding IclR family transcriptional regulator
MLQRGLAILATFDTKNPELTLSEIASRTGMPLNTTSRLVAQLTDWGALTSGEERRYMIGPRVWDLGLLSQVHRELRRSALPLLRDVFAATKRNVHLAVRDGTSALFVERLSEPRTAPLISQPGSRIPLYACGVGKALLAYSPGTVVEEVMAEAISLTDRTIVDPEAFSRELAEVRARGYARTVEEFTRGARSIGVAVLDPSGHAVAAVGVVADSASQDIDQLAPVLQVAARAIARRLDPRADSAYGEHPITE